MLGVKEEKWDPGFSFPHQSLKEKKDTSHKEKDTSHKEKDQ